MLEELNIWHEERSVLLNGMEDHIGVLLEDRGLKDVNKRREAQSVRGKLEPPYRA